MSLLLIGAFVLTIVLAVMPFVPGALEIVRPRDNQRLPIDQGYVRDPHFFGRSFRNLVAPAMAQAPATLPYRSSITLRRPERLEIRESLRVPPGSSVQGVVISQGPVEMGRGAKVGDCYAKGPITVAERATLRAVACDADATLGPRVRIERWLDATGDIEVDTLGDLGHSVSAGGRVLLREHCNFQRVWGKPVITSAPHAAARIAPSIGDVVVFGEKGLSLPRGTQLSEDLVVRGTLRIGSESTIRGNIKAHGSIIIQPGVRIEGNVVTRHDLVTISDVQILGNVFAERDALLGSRTHVGEPEAFKSVYAAGHVRLGDLNQIYGWVVAESGGTVG